MSRIEVKDSLKDLTFAELLLVAIDVEAEKAARVRQRSDVAAKYGITLPVASGSKRKVYADPKTGARYTAGRGRPPVWFMKAKNKAALLIIDGK